MSEWKLFGDEIPEYATPAWYAERDRAPHLEQWGGHRERLIAAANWINAIDGLQSVVDLGAGDGGLLSLLDVPACWGYDLQPSNVAGATERRADVRYADFLNPKTKIEWGELAVMTECLEHLVDPHATVKWVESEWLLASSPAFETDVEHYEFHLWAWDQAGFRALIEGGGYEVLKHQVIGGTQLILGRRP